MNSINQVKKNTDGFVRRELPQNTLGEALKIVREEVGLSVERLASITNIQQKYIEAIEAGRYDQTPGPVYVKGFLRTIANVLELSPSTVISRFESEPHDFPIKETQTSISKLSFFSFVTPKVISAFIIILVALIYFGIQIKKIILPPKLFLSYPTADVILNTPEIVLSGKTEPSVIVQVNDQQVKVDAEGNFKETIDLQPGVNTLVVSAQKKRSRQTTITRRVLVQLNDVVK
ncbi:MAG: helix-turn-helix domain-containing protein [Patescibacteria group bacterium]|jgi:transcriptional regulator with XRE-family HTH domain